jgi:16S rRNA (adenine1518-N6/adenine1519-N6)-dimethyltransferase
VLTLLVRLRYEPRAWFRVSAGCFFPEPAVDSACVTLVRRDQPLVPTAAEETFVRLVKRGFSQRRKMLFKLLKTDWPEPALRRGFDHCGLSLDVRAEAVEESRWATLARVLSDTGSGPGFESHE